MRKKKILVFFLIIFVLMNICTYSFAVNLDNPIMRFLTAIYRSLQILVLGILIISLSIFGILYFMSPFLESITPEKVKELRTTLLCIAGAAVLLFSIQALIDAVYSYVNAEEVEEEEEALIMFRDTIYILANLNK